jgi:CBS domain-containing protein
MRVQDIMTADPACCTTDDTIAAAARLMEEHDCGCIPVIAPNDDARVVGVITDRDIAVRAVARGRDPDTTVGDLMTRSPYCCGPDADVNDVERLMAEQQVRRITVVDEAGRCVGVLAQADLARAAERGRDVTDSDVGQLVEAISEPSRKH